MFERCLHVALITPVSPQDGLRGALATISGEYREFSWYPYYPRRLVQLRSDLLALVKKYKPTHTFFQLQTDGVIPQILVDAIPGVKIEWCGDCRDTTSTHFLKRASRMDVMLFSNMRDVENVRKAGHPADFLQIELFAGSLLPGWSQAGWDAGNRGHAQ